MLSERVRRQVERLLDEAEEAVARLDWETVRDRARAVVAFDPENSDALAFMAAAERGLGDEAPPERAPGPAVSPTSPSPAPTSFADGRYEVKKFLGEGGKKLVYQGDLEFMKEQQHTQRDWIYGEEFLGSDSPRIKSMVAPLVELGLR